MQRRFFLLAAQDPGLIKVQVSLVNVPFAVVDAKGRLVPNLTVNDFEVFEDGAQQKISFFSRAADSSLSLAVLADLSGSQEEFVKDHRRDLRDFLKTVLRPRDQAMLICFRADVWEVSPASNQADHLDDNLKEAQKVKSLSRYRKLNPPEIRDNASSVYDGVVWAARQLETLEGRRAIIIFSDGEDTSSAYNLMDAIEAAQQHSATIFALRYTETKRGEYRARNKQGRGVLQRMAAETGGLEFDAEEERNLREAFQTIAATLRDSYTLAYSSSTPAPDGTFRKISIRCKREGLKVRAKTGYYARREGPL